MTIPEQAVEAAAKGIYDAYTLRYGLFDAPSWNQLSEHDKVGDRADALAALTAVFPLMGVQRPEDVAREILCEFIARQRKKLNEISTPAPGTWSKGYREALGSFERVVLALPHTGQPQERRTETQRFCDAMNGRDIDDFDKRAEHFMVQVLDGLSVSSANRNSVKAALAANFAALSPPPQAGCAKEGEAAALVALARGNIPPDIQELLVRGDPMRSIPPGALSAAVKAAAPPPPVAESGWQEKIVAALHEAHIYGVGATSDYNQKVILEAATRFAALPAPPHIADTAGQRGEP